MSRVPSPLEDPRIGQTLGDGYRITSVLGTGGMGRVYRATQLGVEREVAIKVAIPQTFCNDEAERRFEREAVAVSRLSHPNIVRVYDFGFADDGSPYLVMELLNGRDLDRIVLAHAPLTVDHSLTVAIEALEGLGHAHSRGVMHRDIKPGNLFCEHEGDLKVLDFGLARLTGGAGPAGQLSTPAGRVLGTPTYIAPEQVMGKRGDARSDLYALGVVLYEMLTGVPPFSAASPVALLTKIAFNDVPDPRTAPGGESLSAEIAEVLMRVLAKDPDARFADAAEMQEALEQCHSGRRCDACGKSVRPIARFCKHCGAQIKRSAVRRRGISRNMTLPSGAAPED